MRNPEIDMRVANPEDTVIISRINPKRIPDTNGLKTAVRAWIESTRNKNRQLFILPDLPETNLFPTSYRHYTINPMDLSQSPKKNRERAVDLIALYLEKSKGVLVVELTPKTT